MKLLEDRIRQDGKPAPGGIVRVDSFLNHQMDIDLLDKLAEEFARLFAEDKPDRVLTIEASGIAIAALTARHLGVPMIFAKKSKTANMADDVYATKVYSYTHGNENTVMVPKAYLPAGDRVLLMDDFLANGEALRGLIDLCDQAGATVVGAGILVEKAFQPGGKDLRAKGYRVESLARVGTITDDGTITFVGE